MTGAGDGILDMCSAAGLREAEWAAPAATLDPFGGAGTFGLVANRLPRDSILIETNANYTDLAHKRVADDGLLNAQPQVAA